MVTADKILDAAEKRMRKGGYNAVSFRDLAADTGVKSSSVHYHFRRKEDLGSALVRRYAERFLDALEERVIDVTKPYDRISAFCDVYRSALEADNTICLCGMLGAESQDLPPYVNDAVSHFFDTNIAWIRDSLSTEWPLDECEKFATTTVAALQGGMIIATSLNKPQHFDTIVTSILSGVETLRA